MSLNSVKIPSPIMELAALEHNVVTTLAPSFFFIFFILSGNKDNNKGLDEFNLK